MDTSPVLSRCSWSSERAAVRQDPAHRRPSPQRGLMSSLTPRRQWRCGGAARGASPILGRHWKWEPLTRQSPRWGLREPEKEPRSSKRLEGSKVELLGGWKEASRKPFKNSPLPVPYGEPPVEHSSDLVLDQGPVACNLCLVNSGSGCCFLVLLYPGRVHEAQKLRKRESTSFDLSIKIRAFSISVT